MHYIIIFLAFLITFQTDAAPYEVIVNQASTPLLNPTFAKREVLKLRLENQMELYLVSDPAVDQSATAVTVSTGSWEDPEEHLGMAHFLEHMLFLGTKKYPEESSYQRFVSEHGGQYNAFTASDITSYLLSINHNAFPEAVDRLASFFKEPLFNPSGVERELNAIDQEHAKNLDNDSWRQHYVFKELANPTHPAHKFSTGNKNTLKNTTQEELLKWYKTHYSANRMRVIAISNLPMDTLKKLIIEAFSDVENRELSTAAIDTPLFNDSIKGKMIYIEPVKNIRQLTLSWELPASFVDKLETKPDQLASYVLGHEGRASLLAALKREKLADGVYVGSDREGGRNSLFTIVISLTDEGVKRTDEVIHKTFEAITNLKERGVPLYLFEEIQTMDRVAYQYQGRSDPFNNVMQQAIALSREPIATFPELSSMIMRFDSKDLQELMNLLTPKSGIYSLIAPEELTLVPFEKKEQWMGVNYTVRPIETEKLSQWAEVVSTPHIDVPSLNPFIPEQLALHTLQEDSVSITQYTLLPIPKEILNDETGIVYAAQDKQYRVPEVTWIYYIRTPAVKADNPETLVMADLYTQCLMDELRNYTYPAAVAGLHFAVAPNTNGIQIVLSGYSDKAKEFFQDVVTEALNFKPEQTHYKAYKDILQREYRNMALDTPILQASEHQNKALIKNYVTDVEKSKALKKVSFAKFQNFLEGLYKKTYIQGMLYGNMPEGQPQEITEFLKQSLNSTPYPTEEHFAKEINSLPSDKGPFFLNYSVPSLCNAALLTIHVPSYSMKAKAANSILMQAIKQPFFTTLRTKQQTGYIVKSQSEERVLNLFNTFMVQSNTHDPKDLLSRFELFIEEFLQNIPTEITLDRFENIRHSLLAQMKQQPNTIQEMGSSLFTLLTQYDADFMWEDKQIQALEEITYFEFLEHARQTLGKQNKQRLAILMKGTLASETTFEYIQLER